MANEITASVKLASTKAGCVSDSDDMGVTGIQITQSGTEFVRTVQLVGFSAEEPLLIGDVTPGLCVLKNLDPTNFISVRGASGAVACIKLMPGEPNLFRFSGTAPYVIADTGNCRLAIYLLES